MTALSDAREYLKTVSVDSYRYDHPIQLLHRIVAEIEAAPKVKVRGKVGELATIHVSHSLVGQTVRLLGDG
jgi:hypothetical protein